MSFVPCPQWAHPPSATHHWQLLELKDGQVVHSYSLNSLCPHGFLTIGRRPDADLVTSHESCSRHHARLAFDRHGTLWLRDLGSGNGTFVNGRPLPHEACGKSESEGRGSRGVVVFPGDAIRFGASTRVFCVEGPLEFERGNNNNDNNNDNSNNNNDNSNNDNHDVNSAEPVRECQWGLGQEDQVEEHLMKDRNLPSMDLFFSDACSETYKVTETLRHLYQSYQTRKYKLECIQIESQRILQKETMGVELTDGQKRQLERNQQRLQQLEQEIEETKEKIQEGIYQTVHGRDAAQQGTRKRRQHGESDEDVDEFYDRTIDNKKRQAQDNSPETEQSLIQKWTLLHASVVKQQEITTRASHQCLKIKNKIAKTDDEEEMFFLTNDLALVNDDLGKAQKSLEDIEKEMSETEYLLVLVNPKVTWDRQQGWIGTKKESDNDMPSESVMAPPPPKISSQSPTNNFIESPTSSQTLSQEVYFENSRILGPAMSPSSTSVIHSTPSIENNSNNDTVQHHDEADQSFPLNLPLQSPARRKGKIQGTLAALHHSAHSQSIGSKGVPVSQSLKNKQVTAFDPRKDEWSAPNDQDGSGRTSLHDKFQGRY